MMKNRKTHVLRDDSASLMRLFLIFAAAAMFMTFEFAILTRGKTIQFSLFWNGTYSDHFMDFFNTLRDSHDLTWVYQRNVIYPPLSVLFMYFVSRLVPESLAALPTSERLTLQQNRDAEMLYFIFAAVCILILAFCIERYLEQHHIGWERFAVTAFCIVSFPVIYCMERGNLSLLAAVFSAFFIFFRNSENKVVRELCYLALALAAGLKLFPAVLGVLIIYDKRYFAALRTIVYGAIMIAVPYLIVKLLTPDTGIIDTLQPISASSVTTNDGTIVSTDGSISRLVFNLMRWINKKDYFTYNSVSITNLAYLFTDMNLIAKRFTQPVGNVAFLITEAAALILGFFCKKEWQRVFLAIYMMLNIHSISMHYTLLYVIPVLVILLAESRTYKVSGIDRLSVILLSLQIVPLPYLTYGWTRQIEKFFRNELSLNISYSYNKFLSCPTFQLLAFAVMLDVLLETIFDIKKGKFSLKSVFRREPAATPAAA